MCDILVLLQQGQAEEEPDIVTEVDNVLGKLMASLQKGNPWRWGATHRGTEDYSWPRHATSSLLTSFAAQFQGKTKISNLPRLL